MSERFNIYCDESCHLEHDRQPAMVLGAVWCPTVEAHGIARRVREIKRKYKIHPKFEIKWVKASAARLAFYEDLIDYFFDDDDAERVVLALCDFSYVVVTEVRRDYLILWTAYCVRESHRQRKLEREFLEWYRDHKKS